MEEIKKLQNYAVPSYRIVKTFLDFTLDKETTIVTNTMNIEKLSSSESEHLILDGINLEFISIEVDGKQFDNYEITPETMILTGLSGKFELKIKNKIKPVENLSLEGLYISGNILCTQCEAEGFRKITWFLDRPDNMSLFTVRIEGNRDEFPVVLSNGNLIESGELPQNRHFRIFEDPFPKPSYLFALVGGNLSNIEDTFTTISGRQIELKIFVEKENIHKCDHALNSLKKAMKWDEDTFGREYDLNSFYIVAVDSFNAGAMENKGLNIFNSRYVLADPQTATDTDYENILGVIGHEYFHNWSGNRVTLRDWFQLSLKEGLTVFRDQEFSSDMLSRAVKRVEDAYAIRSAQFSEDASPLSHPVRPDTYKEINNFYTLTVYEKGAEVIRMIHTMATSEAFRKGMDLYFESYDGKAVTCEDFVSAMSEASGKDFSGQFFNWYTQKGTPELTVEFKKQSKRGVLSLTQRFKEDVDAPDMVIPVKTAFVDKSGLIDTSIDGGKLQKEHLIIFSKKKQTYTVDNISEDCVPSILREFSAPCHLKYSYTEEDLYLLARKDTDPYVRWDSLQRLYLMQMEKGVNAFLSESDFAMDSNLLKTMEVILKDTRIDDQFRAMLLRLPGERFAGEELGEIQVDALADTRLTMRRSIGKILESEWLELIEDRKHKESTPSSRSVTNLAKAYLTTADESYSSQVWNDFISSKNMTDSISAFSILTDTETEYRQKVIDSWYDKFSSDFLPLVSWFSIQAQSRHPDTIKTITELFKHEKFDIKNPNMARGLVGGLCVNHLMFNKSDGSSYNLAMNKIVEIDSFNPIAAARLFAPFSKWRKYADPWKSQLQRTIKEMLNISSISRHLKEQGERALS
ncbi:MAG: aminopeptidase N [Deltaproteobacteria bacterium]|nr:aminopeptidase N [Deltaproteobacteria bacterium]